LGYYAQKYKHKMLIINTLYCGRFSSLINTLGGQFSNSHCEAGGEGPGLMGRGE
jgi:hypothetical protein